jgi:hypothetical protein
MAPALAATDLAFAFSRFRNETKSLSIDICFQTDAIYK